MHKIKWQEKVFTSSIANVEKIDNNPDYYDYFLAICKDPLNAPSQLATDDFKTTTVFGDRSLLQSFDNIYRIPDMMNNWYIMLDRIKGLKKVISKYDSSNFIGKMESLTNLEILCPICSLIDRE